LLPARTICCKRELALLQVAAAGKLRTPDVLRTQALRMLNDRRASSLVRNFALKALDLDKLAEVVPDPNLFPTSGRHDADADGARQRAS
jgi:hypothetical protein